VSWSQRENSHDHECYRPVPSVAQGPSGHARLAEKVTIRDLNFFYGEYRALRSISLPLDQNKVTAVIGLSGCQSAPLDLKFDKRPALTDAIRWPARAAFRAASRQDGNSGSLLRSPPTIQSGPKSLNRDTCRNVRRSNLPHCDRVGSS
jgi:hypothetical protein